VATQLPFQTGQQVSVRGGRVDARKTAPPARYTDATLLDDMVGVHKYVTDERMRSILMKTKGLGTERTRPDVIEKIIADGLVLRDGKYLDASPLAIELDSFIDEGLGDPARTALLEFGLQNVAEGKTTPAAFMGGIEKYVQQVVDRALILEIDGTHIQTKREKGGYVKKERPQVEPLPGHGEACSKCGEGKMETRLSSKNNKTFLGCNAYPKCKNIQS
jgi:DNA topoisomerase-3